MSQYSKIAKGMGYLAKSNHAPCFPHNSQVTFQLFVGFVDCSGDDSNAELLNNVKYAKNMPQRGDEGLFLYLKG